MKKILIIAVCIVLAAVLLLPIPMYMEDGGTVEYTAVLYSVADVHRLNQDEETDAPYQEGTIIKILEFEVFNNVQ